MVQNLKALVVVLGLGLPCLWFLRGWALNYMSRADYVRRCGVWTAITVAAFAAPNYWLYCLVSVPLLWWSGKRDHNPIALVLFLLHVVPPVSVDLPVIGINRLFDVNHYRWLSLLILLPALLRQPSMGLPTAADTKVAHLGVIGYLALTLGLVSMYSSITDIMRNVAVACIDTLIVYFAFNRLVRNRESLREALACLAIATTPVALVAVWESARYWLLYAGLYATWGSTEASLAWLFRGDALRAQSSTGHSMLLGFVTAIAFSFWLGAVDWARFNWRQAILPMIVLAGCAASVSRGGWVVACVVYVVYLFIGPFRSAQLFRHLSFLAAVTIVAMLAPGGEKLIQLLPFVGSDNANIDYRAQLADLSWKLVWYNPWFGDLFALRHMESLRQGQGIIDTVNVYSTIALFYGFVGLALFVLPALVAVKVALSETFRCRRLDREQSSPVAAVSAAMIGTLVMLSVISFAGAAAYFYWALIGLAVGLSRLRRGETSEPVRRDTYAPFGMRSPRQHVAR
jgi:O-Antigen ligase